VKPEDCYRTCTKTTDYQCKDDVVTTYTENCACTTSCVPGEWEITNTEQTGEEWGECQRQAVNASTVRPPGCLKQGTATFLITEFNGCDTRTRTETRSIREGCECPDPGACYYTPDCRLDARAFHTATAACPEEAKQRLCEAEGGIWGNWNSQHNQCKTDLPGLYLENFRLVPGQSHSDCLKFTGN
jgi:hypothetical protein